MNIRAMEDRVLVLLEQETEAEVYWTRADVRAALSEGLAELADLTEYHEVVFSVPLLYKRTYYDLRAHTRDGEVFLAPRRVHSLVTERWLDWRSYGFLDARYSPWEPTISAPDKAFTRGFYWLGVFGKAEGDTGAIRVTAVTIPNTPNADSDTPPFPAQFHLAAVEYATYDLLIQDGETDLALQHWSEYSRIAGLFTSHVESRQSISRVLHYKDH